MEEQLKQQFKKAAEIVKELPETLKPVAFEIAMTHMWGATQEKKGQKIPIISPSTNTENDFFEKMQTETGIEQEQLKAVYRIDKNSLPKLIISLEGKLPEKQRTIALLYLLCTKIGLRKDWISPEELVIQIGEYGAKDRNISRNLRMEKDILQSGKSQGKEYGLSPNGVQKAKRLLNNLLHG